MCFKIWCPNAPGEQPPLKSAVRLLCLILNAYSNVPMLIVLGLSGIGSHPLILTSLQVHPAPSTQQKRAVEAVPLAVTLCLQGKRPIKNLRYAALHVQQAFWTNVSAVLAGLPQFAVCNDADPSPHHPLPTKAFDSRLMFAFPPPLFFA